MGLLPAAPVRSAFMGFPPRLGIYGAQHWPHTSGTPVLLESLRSHLLQVLGTQLSLHSAGYASMETIDSHTVWQ